MPRDARPARGVVVRPMVPGDHAVVHAMNDAAAPHVNVLDAESFAWLVRACDYTRVAVRDGAIVGFVFAIRHGTEYWSANYAWFTERYDAFLYLDRVVVAPEARHAGVGRALYNDLVAFALGQWPRVALEVNLDPPNPASLAFHAAMGFERVGERHHDGGAVVMLVRPT